MDPKDFLVVKINTGIERSLGVSEQPVIELRCWSVFQVSFEGSDYPFIVGSFLHRDYGRRSTPVITWDFHRRAAQTRSGRRYELHGPPSQHPDALWVWNISMCGVPYTDISDQIWARMKAAEQ